MRFIRSATMAVMMCAGGMASAQEAIQLPLVEDISVSSGLGANPPDILGIHFGDTAQDAIAKLKAAYPDAEIVETRVVPGLKDQRGNSVYFDYLFAVGIRTLGEPREDITVRFTTAATGGRVFQIMRGVSYGADAPGATADLRAAIAGKYGDQPTLIQHNSRNSTTEIDYTWETRAVQSFGEVDAATRGVGSVIPDVENKCLRTTISPYWAGGNDSYSFTPPGLRAEDPEYAACVGLVHFLIEYGANENTVKRVSTTGTDYARAKRDALIVDELLVKLIEEKAQGVQGQGAPTL